MWSVYTLDHLNDARKMHHTYNERRLFFLKNEGSLKTALIFVVITGIVSIYFVSLYELFFGLMLGVAIVTYLFFQNSIGKRGLKELFIAVVYSTAVFSQVLLFSILDIQITLTLIQLVIIAQVNLIIISLFDFEDDTLEGFNSIAIILGKSNTNILAVTLILGSLFIAVTRFWSFLPQLQFFFILSSMLLLSILVFPGFFKQKQYYRILADGIFMLPIFFKSFWV